MKQRKPFTVLPGLLKNRLILLNETWTQPDAPQSQSEGPYKQTIFSKPADLHDGNENIGTRHDQLMAVSKIMDVKAFPQSDDVTNKGKKSLSSFIAAG